MLYDYGCTECGETLKDVKQSIHDEPLKKCPSCGKNSLERVIYGGLGSFMKDSSTIGGKADNNWSKMGSYQKSEIEAKSKAKVEANDKKDLRKQLNNMTSEQRTNYIMRGDK
jgi:putative FmdB family regulatory protein